MFEKDIQKHQNKEHSKPRCATVWFRSWTSKRLETSGRFFSGVGMKYFVVFCLFVLFFAWFLFALLGALFDKVFLFVQQILANSYFWFELLVFFVAMCCWLWSLYCLFCVMYIPWQTENIAEDFIKTSLRSFWNGQVDSDRCVPFSLSIQNSILVI